MTQDEISSFNQSSSVAQFHPIIGNITSYISRLAVTYKDVPEVLKDFLAKTTDESWSLDGYKESVVDKVNSLALTVPDEENRKALSESAEYLLFLKKSCTPGSGLCAEEAGAGASYCGPGALGPDFFAKKLKEIATSYMMVRVRE